MSITLSPENEKFIERAVARGQYKDYSEAIGAAVGLLRERQRSLTELRNDIQAGRDSGDPVPGDRAFEQLERKAEEIA